MQTVTKCIFHHSHGFKQILTHCKRNIRISCSSWFLRSFGERPTTLHEEPVWPTQQPVKSLSSSPLIDTNYIALLNMTALWQCKPVPKVTIHANQGCSGTGMCGATFWQIFLNRNGAPANIVYHRRNADTAAFRQISSGRGRVYYDLPTC